MHHLFVTPLVAGVVTAGIIAFSPSFSDPYQTEFSSEEPVVERLDLEFSASISAPAELSTPTPPTTSGFVAAYSTPVRIAKLDMDRTILLTDAAFQRPDVVLAAAPISNVETVKLSTEGPRLEVTASRMNMRAGPGTTYKRVGQLVQGTRLEPTGKSDGPWLEVSVLNSDSVGWLHSKYLNEVK